VGSLLGTSMYCSNIINVQKQAALNDGLGDVNPTPFPTIVSSCAGWCIYGILSKNQWVWWSNFPGLLIGLFLCCEAIGACGQNEKDSQARKGITRSLIFWVGVWSSIGWMVTFRFQQEVAKKVVGFSACGVLMIMYGAPLSTLATVLRTGDSSSLYLPTCCIAATCTFLWTVCTHCYITC